MNAVLSVEGVEVNFYRWPLKTYRLMKGFAKVKESGGSSQDALLVRFRLFGVLTFFFGMLIPIAAILYPSVVGFHFGGF